MTNYNFGDILLVPFPFTDQTSSKKRPAVIISSNPYNQQKPDLIIMAITSQIISPITFGELHIIDFSAAGLIRKLGQLPDSDCQNLTNLIQTILG